MASAPLQSPKLRGFDLLQANYKQIGDHGIRVDVLVPQRPSTGKMPVITHFHAGGLMMGDSLFMDWWPHWLSDLALKHDAIIISPNYRLMPEATVPDIFQDLEGFWSWIHSPALIDLLAPINVEPDLSRVLTAGGSSGGLISVALALAHASDIRASIASCPWIDPTGEEYAHPRTSTSWGPSHPESVVTDTLRSAAVGTAVSSDFSASRVDFMQAATQHGHLAAVYARGTDKDLQEPSVRRLWFPVEALQRPGGIDVPPGGIVLFASVQDPAVLIGGLRKFMASAGQVRGGGGITLTEREEGGHLFDADLRLDEEPWLQSTLENAVESWLQ